MPRQLKLILLLWYALAVLLPWTGVPWRALSIPSGTVVVFLAAGLCLFARWRLAAGAAFERLDSLPMERPVRAIAALFLVWLVNIKLCQYFTFQSHYCDLGQDANICWNTLLGRPFFDSYMRTNFLGDHFEPVLALCALGLKLWRSPAMLLVIQSVATSLAIWPLFALARLHTRHPALALGIVALFVLNPFLHMVNEFDFHPDPLFIPAALWALLCWEKGRPLAALLIALPCLGIKEDVPLALAGFGAYVALSRRYPSRLRAGGWLLIALAAAGFGLITLRLIPHFAGSAVSVHQDRYASLGHSAAEIMRNVAWHPWLVVLRLLRPRVLLTCVLLLATTGFLPLGSPLALVPVLAACLHHLLSDYRSQYALVSQYSAQTVPFLFYAAIKGLGSWDQRLWDGRRWALPGLIFLCGLGLLFQPFYIGRFHWRNVRAAERLVRLVPAQAGVASDGSSGLHGEDLLVHLSLRPELIRLTMAEPFGAPAADFVLLNKERSRAYGHYLEVDAGFSLVGEGDSLGLWRRQRSGTP